MELTADSGHTPTDPESECERMRQQLEKLNRELDEAKSEVAVSAYLQETLAESERQKTCLQEELATMQTLLVEADEQQQDKQFARLRHHYKLIEAENRDLKIQLRLAEGRQRSGTASGTGSRGAGGGVSGTPNSSSSTMPDRETLLGGAAVLSDKTKSMVRKMKSSVVQSVTTAPGLSPEDELRRAQEDADLLRSIVLPLEEQIVALKGKLRESDSLLQEYEKKQGTALQQMEAVAAWVEGTGDKESLEHRLKEAVGDGYSEEEGQLYHAMLAARIGMLSLEMDTIRIDRDEVTSQLEVERRELTGLRTSLERANSALLAERSAHLDQITKLTSLLTEDQVAEYRKVAAEIQAAADSGLAAARDRSPVTRIVSEEEWEQLQARLDGIAADGGLVRGGGGAAVAGEVEKLKQEVKELVKERDHLAGNCEKYRGDLAHEAAFRKEMESTWNCRGSEYRAEVTELAGRLKITEQALEKVGSMYRTMVESSRKDLHALTRDRERIVRELKRLQEENDNLVGKHSTLAQTMANEVIDLPNSLEEMQLLLLKYREELITAKIAKERAEERLKSDVGQVRSQLAGEQQAKSQIEALLGQEIQKLRERLRVLERSGVELERERERSKALEQRLVLLEQVQSHNSAEASKQLEAALQSKKSVEVTLGELRNKVSSLQADLDNSVAVQNDFVRLSQSLQVELEKIRQGEKEVRWQHEEDVEDCNSCRSHFSASKKRKSNCKHCGRIFCPDCLTKQVPSGSSGRTTAVCDVCHTLLVQHSAPYFSIEAPHTD